MRRNKLKLVDLKVGMVVTYMADRGKQVEFLTGRIESIEQWTGPNTYKIVLTVGDPENQAMEIIFTDIFDFEVTFVEGVI